MVVPKRGYRRYIKSEAWRNRRARTAKKRRCEACERVGAVDVHHRTYSTLGVERGWELVALCRRCHLEVHRRAKQQPDRALWHVTDDVIYSERAIPESERWWRTVDAKDPEEQNPDAM